MKDEAIIKNLEAGLLALFSPEDADAMAFLRGLFILFQGIDDYYDGDLTDKDDIVDLHFNALSELYGNPFFRRYGHKITPMIESAHLQWQSANRMESSGLANEKSYMLRAYYYQIVHFCAAQLYGNSFAINNAISFQRFYGETYSDYIEEFKDA